MNQNSAGPDRKIARLYYRKMKWTMPLLYDDYTVKRFLSLKDEPATVIIGPDSRVAYTYVRHLPQEAYLATMNREIKKLLK